MRRSCVRKMMARQPPRRNRKSVLPIPPALRPARTGNTSFAGACHPAGSWPLLSSKTPGPHAPLTASPVPCGIPRENMHRRCPCRCPCSPAAPSASSTPRTPIRPKRPGSPSTPQTSPARWRYSPNSRPGSMGWNIMSVSGCSSPSTGQRLRACTSSRTGRRRNAASSPPGPPAVRAASASGTAAAPGREHPPCLACGHAGWYAFAGHQAPFPRSGQRRSVVTGHRQRCLPGTLAFLVLLSISSCGGHACLAVWNMLLTETKHLVLPARPADFT